MNSRTRHRRCDAWATSPVAAFSVAVLGMLLIAVAMCLGSTTHTLPARRQSPP
ncbi:hypothetical protein [Streptomyces sp. NPDC012616]|uniref:hypothetical protein n=1 Tax=Streptomyces sp. NPDC012616 TaxID=3364840 RepID=UPI0036E18987